HRGHGEIDWSLQPAEQGLPQKWHMPFQIYLDAAFTCLVVLCPLWLIFT
ncbi:MAG: hypothetical protein ACI8P0_006211, partial [Planctomycetaceae bacterium]